MLCFSSSLEAPALTSCPGFMMDCRCKMNSTLSSSCTFDRGVYYCNRKKRGIPHGVVPFSINKGKESHEMGMKAQSTVTMEMCIHGTGQMGKGV